MLQEEVELWVAARVDCDFKQRQEDVLQHLLEVSQLLFGSVHVTARHKRTSYVHTKQKHVQQHVFS